MSSMEKVYESLKAILIAHLPTKLATVNAEYSTYDATNYGAALDLPAPASDSYFFEDYAIPSGAYPAVVVIMPKGNKEFNGNAKEIRGEVQVHVQDYGDGRVQRITRRYVQAIDAILQDHPTLDGGCKLIRTGGDGYGDYANKEDGGFFRAGGLEFVAKIT